MDGSLPGGPRPPEAPRLPRTAPAKGDSALAALISASTDCEVLFDPASRGRYATDASFYQIEPIGVVVPKSLDDLYGVLDIALNEGVPVLPRGGGTSQAGQTVGAALVVDTSKHLNRMLDLDLERGTVDVQPGLVLDHLNQFLKPHGVWFPVDISTGSRATLGGMAANNSCGGRSIRYGRMRENVAEIQALLADGSAMTFGEIDAAEGLAGLPAEQGALVERLLAIGRREADAVRTHFPDLRGPDGRDPVLRRVGGYNLDALAPGDGPVNLAHLLVGSEGTLGFFERIRLTLAPLPRNVVAGICHFPTFYQAMDAAQHLVTLGPIGVELIDRTMIGLGRDIPLYRPTVEQAIQGDPDAVLVVEFAEETQAESLAQLDRLDTLMADLGFPGSVVRAVDPGFRAAVGEFRKAGLNVMMSMKSAGKPVSFVEDCAVPLPDLAEYTRRLTEIFQRHGTSGTWYAHASVGCLHVRPILNLKLDTEVRKLRAIAEEAFALVRDYRGSHSGEHGDGLVRSEFHEAMFGSRIVRAFEEVKDTLDPEGRMNPGKIVRPPRMDDRSLFRYPPEYAVAAPATGFDWSAWGGFGGAVEMCNNNGACRKIDANVMCPSYRVTKDEKDVVRGRANTLRLALSGQLGPDALTSEAMMDTLALCVGCKGCRRECPTGVDMAKMKTEVLYQRSKQHGVPRRERLIAHLPHYAPLVGRVPWIGGLPDRLPGARRLGERWLGLSARRSLPRWAARPFRSGETAVGPVDGTPVVLWVDTFTRWFEPEVPRAALSVLTAAGCRVHLPQPTVEARRPLCCGRAFLAAGMVDQARAELRRSLDTLAPLLGRGMPVIGLEPSCLLTFRDELPALLPGPEAERAAGQALLLEEFLDQRIQAGHRVPLRPIRRPTAAAGSGAGVGAEVGAGAETRILLHGHCHQKAFAAMNPVERVLAAIPNVTVETVPSSCCGMAGAFGYGAETYDISQAMGELALLPAVRAAAPDTLIVADGTSCRHQIADGTGRRAVHAAVVLARALEARPEQEHR